MPHLLRLFGGVRKNKKGAPIPELFKQIFCFLVDGTSRHLTYFDQLQQDTGYAAALETTPDKLQSSHAIKRFFRSLSAPRVFLFRRLLQHLFIWRLKLAKPAVINLGLDSMVLDNDDAACRQGVKYTYKKVNGFHPLQLNWGPYIVDAVFRGGNRHSNYADHVEKMLRHVTRLIRKHYRPDVPILIRWDSGFFDQKLMALADELGIGFTGSGTLYEDITSAAAQWPREAWTTYQNGASTWEYIELGDRRQDWHQFQRAIFMRLTREPTGQGLLAFARPDAIIYTNLGKGGTIDTLLRAAQHEHMFDPVAIITFHHQRGTDELVNRALKEFREQRLPFQKFLPNMAFYYLMLTAFFLFEAFTLDVAAGVVAPGAYANTVRRIIIDVAAKSIRTSHRIILKVTRVVWIHLKWRELWDRSGKPPPFRWA